MVMDTEAIEIRLFALKLENCGTVRWYYDEMRALSDDLQSCSQPKPTDQLRYRYLKFKLPKAWGQYKRVLRWNIKDNDYLTIILELKFFEEELRKDEGIKFGKAFFLRRARIIFKRCLRTLRKIYLISHAITVG